MNPHTLADGCITAELTEHGWGLITLTRPQALNALTLPMVQGLLHTLRSWQDAPAVKAVAIRGSNKLGPFGAFCAGGDIRFFHQAAHAGSADLATFFTEEYTLNHLIHQYKKPYVAWMDGVVMGGGMGISQGASLRVVTERSKLAMPEALIGLFPDVGGGYFLSRCPGHMGEYLALTGAVVHAAEAIELGLADVFLPSEQLPELWHMLPAQAQVRGRALAFDAASPWGDAPALAPDSFLHQRAIIDAVFGLPSVSAILDALERASDRWSQHTAHALRARSPLMLHVILEQVRRARGMGLADDLRMERDMVHHCFHLRPVLQSETVEGIRALAVDKDHQPQWRPAQAEAVQPQEVAQFFASPWSAQNHPLRAL
jgi:enoyl-CoA hydratase/carnithine racemase